MQLIEFYRNVGKTFTVMYNKNSSLHFGMPPLMPLCYVGLELQVFSDVLCHNSLTSVVVLVVANTIGTQ